MQRAWVYLASLGWGVACSTSGNIAPSPDSGVGADGGVVADASPTNEDGSAAGDAASKDGGAAAGDSGASAYAGSWLCTSADDGGGAGATTVVISSSQPGSIALAAAPDAGSSCTLPFGVSGSVATLTDAPDGCGDDAGAPLPLPGSIPQPSAGIPPYQIVSQAATGGTLTLQDGGLDLSISGSETQFYPGDGGSQVLTFRFDDVCARE